VIYAPIPRKLWEAKPQIDNTGIIGGLLMGDESWGLPAGAYGWIYLNFWWFGIIIFGLITGFVAAKFYKIAMHQIRSNIDYVFLFYILAVTSLTDIFTTAGQIKLLFSCLIIILIKFLDKSLSVFYSDRPLITTNQKRVGG